VPDEFVAAAIQLLGLIHLDVNYVHALATFDPLHNDPFDRFLIAQARVESLSLVTDDPIVKRYDVPTIW
jgi:PIN domain nuclease of toxin-antitoxin system